MNYRLSLSFFLGLLLAAPTWCSAQLKGQVRDRATGLPIPYAAIWHDQADKGTTAGTDGTFLLAAPGKGDKKLVIAAAGYESARVTATTGSIQVDLKPKAAKLKNAAPARPRNSNTQVLGDFKKSSLKDNFYSNDGTPYVLARHYPYEPGYAQTPFLQSITLYTWSKIPQATFQLRLYETGANGEPGEDLLPGNLVVTAAKGRRQTTVDISRYQLVMPGKGLFIGFEWLVIDSNKREYHYTGKSGKIKHQAVSYEPGLGISTEAGSERWMYLGGAWRRSASQRKEIPAKLLFKLTLSD